MENIINTSFLDISRLSKNAHLCISECDSLDAGLARSILSVEEFENYMSFKSEETKLHYVLGRYSAKLAFLKSLGSAIPQNSLEKSKKRCPIVKSINCINIKRGVLHQPVLENERFDVSISHSGHCGLGLVFERRCPMGVDLEKIDPSRRKALESVTSSTEILDGSILQLTAAWSMKEALSKALRCGLTVPFDFLKIKHFQWNSGEEEFICDFANFSQYTGVSKPLNDKILSIVFPAACKHKNSIENNASKC